MSARFWSRVDKTDDCWLWTGPLHDLGYAQRIQIDGERIYPHRYAYELLVGPIPDGLEIDHLCRVRHCVNPDHLEAVTHRENLMRSPRQVTAVNARKTHCPRGHRYSGRDKRGWRECRECRSFSTVGRAGSPTKGTPMSWFKRTHVTHINDRLAIYGYLPRKRYFIKAWR